MSKYQLKRAGNLVSLQPWISSLESLLTYSRASVQVQGYKTVPVKHKEKLFSVKEGIGYFPAGLLKRVIKWFDKNKTDYDYTDFRDTKKLFPTPAFNKVEKLRENQDKVLVAVAQNDKGLIVCNTGFGKSFLIRQICLMYPTLKIIITSPGRDEVKNLYDSFKDTFHKDTLSLIGGGKDGGPHKRITICTNKSLLKTDLEGCDMLLFDEVHSVGHNSIAKTLMQVKDARMLGFTATPSGRSDKSEMVMHSLFGDIIAEYDYQTSVAAKTAAPIEVWLYEVEGKDHQYQNMVSKKRNFIWRHRNRNEAIKKAVRQFSDEEQVLIMVDTLEHAMHLKKLLPEYTCVYGTSNKKDYEEYKRRGFTTDNCMTNKERNRIYDDFKEGKLKKVIATLVWKQGVDFSKLSVLCRADGGPSPILSSQIPGRLSRIAEGKGKAILLDFMDSYCKWGIGRFNKRLAHYRKNGWNIIRKG